MIERWGDERTAEQYRDDMIRYGPCPLCGTARTVRLSEDDAGMTLSMICPAEKKTTSEC